MFLRTERFPHHLQVRSTPPTLPRAKSEAANSWGQFTADAKELSMMITLMLKILGDYLLRKLDDSIWRVGSPPPTWVRCSHVLKSYEQVWSISTGRIYWVLILSSFLPTLHLLRQSQPHVALTWGHSGRVFYPQDISLTEHLKGQMPGFTVTVPWKCKVHKYVWVD